MKTVFIKFCVGDFACTEFLRCSVEESLVKEITFPPESSVDITAQAHETHVATSALQKLLYTTVTWIDPDSQTFSAILSVFLIATTKHLTRAT